MPEGRRWGDWRVDKANRRKIEAVLGLWMLHFKKLEKSKPSGTRSLRVLDIEKAAFGRWIRRGQKPSGPTCQEEPAMRLYGS